jgi:hypothetical protein
MIQFPGSDQQCAGQFLSAEIVGTGRHDQLTELALLAALELPGLVGQRPEFGVVITDLAHRSGPCCAWRTLELSTQPISRNHLKSLETWPSRD